MSIIFGHIWITFCALQSLPQQQSPLLKCKSPWYMSCWIVEPLLVNQWPKTTWMRWIWECHQGILLYNCDGRKSCKHTANTLQTHCKHYGHVETIEPSMSLYWWYEPVHFFWTCLSSYLMVGCLWVHRPALLGDFVVGQGYKLFTFFELPPVTYAANG
jgi:hypothetical protein